MSANALRECTLALQQVIHSAVGLGTPDASVHLGPIDTVNAPPPPVSLFLFHVEPNREMRNAPRLTGVDTRQASLALDLRFLISFNVPSSAGPGTEDLAQMGAVLSKLEANPTLAPPMVTEQEIRLTPEPYPMEEMSRVWGLFPNRSYRTSVVYLATPVFVDAAAIVPEERVGSRRFDAGQSVEPPDFRREEA